MNINYVRTKVVLVNEDKSGYNVDLNLNIKSSDDIVGFLYENIRLHEFPQERVYALYLSSQNKILGVHEVSVGSLSMSVLDPREIMKPAILLNAASIILAHNHPGGSMSPSKGDIQVTRKIDDGCSLFSINLLDHIIVGNVESEGSYLSMRAEGYLG